MIVLTICKNAKTLPLALYITNILLIPPERCYLKYMYNSLSPEACCFVNITIFSNSRLVPLDFVIMLKIYVFKNCSSIIDLVLEPGNMESIYVRK